MTLIKRHVGEQTGNKGDDRAAAGDNTGNANVIENIGQYEGEITAAAAETSAEEKAKKVTALMDKIKAANPNYKGDFDAVQAALAASKKK